MKLHLYALLLVTLCISGVLCKSFFTSETVSVDESPDNGNDSSGIYLEQEASAPIDEEETNPDDNDWEIGSNP